MGTLPILTRDNRNGTVFVQDEHPDGTIVVLRCSDEQTGSGVAVRPQARKVWPMFLAMEAEGLRLEDLLPSDFQVVLDVSELPPGRLEFDLGQFIRQIESKVDEGAKVIELERRDASQWGLRIAEAAH